MRSDLSEGCGDGLCASDAPPLVGDRLTGAGMTLAEAADALERGEEPPLTSLQRRLVEDFALRR